MSAHLTRDKDNFKRTFHFVDKRSINRSTTSNLKTLKGTRKLHCVKGVRPGVIDVREFSCLCKFCIGLQSEGPCDAVEYTDSWKREDLLLNHIKKCGTRKRKLNCSENGSEIKKRKVKKIKKINRKAHREFIPCKRIKEKENCEKDSKASGTTNKCICGRACKFC